MSEPVPISQPWRCDACELHGFVRGLSNWDAKQIKDHAEREHYLAAGPNCPGPVRVPEKWLFDQRR